MIFNYDGNAIVYCEGAFNTTNGKTAHGLVRFTRRFDVHSVVDSRYAGKDALEVLDGKKSGIKIFESAYDAAAAAAKTENLRHISSSDLHPTAEDFPAKPVRPCGKPLK